MIWCFPSFIYMSLQDLHNFDVFAGERSIEKAFSPTLSFESFPAAA